MAADRSVNRTDTLEPSLAAAGDATGLPPRAARLWPLVFYAALAIAATWPLGANLGRALPRGTEPAVTVPLFNLWTVWWNADRAAHLFRGYWNAPIFHPTEDAFVFSEPQPTTIIVAPLAAWPMLAYNVYILAALALNGWSAWLLLRHYQLSALPALMGGAVIELLPFVHWQFGVLQLVPLWGVIWTIYALARFGEAPGLARGAVLGLAFATTYLLCNYYGLYLSVLLIAGGLWLVGRRLFAWRMWAGLLAGAAVSGALVAPVVAAQLRVSRAHDWKRELSLIEGLSAWAGDYTASPPSVPPHLPNFAAEQRAEWWLLSPGYIKAALAMVGIGLGLIVPRWRWFTLFCTTLLATAFLLSLGPKAEWREVAPYRWLMWYYPGFAHIRSPFRFAVFVQLMIGLLCALGLQAFSVPVLSRLAGWRRGVAVVPGRMLKAVSAVLVLLAGTAAAGELWPMPQALYRPASLEANRGWIDWLRSNVPSDTPIACVPFPTGRDVYDYEETAIWMYWGMFHRRALVNGYSGFFPQTFLDLHEVMQRFPDGTSLNSLEEFGVQYVVARRSAYPRTSIEGDPAVSKRLVWRFGDDRAGIDIYELRPHDDEE